MDSDSLFGGDLMGDIGKSSVLSPYVEGKNKGYEIGQIIALHRIGWKTKDIAAECRLSEQAVKRVTDDCEFSADTYATRGVDKGSNEVGEEEDNILLVGRLDVPGMAHVVYGGDVNAPFFEPESNSGTRDAPVPDEAAYPGCSKDNPMTATKVPTSPPRRHPMLKSEDFWSGASRRDSLSLAKLDDDPTRSSSPVAVNRFTPAVRDRRDPDTILRRRPSSPEFETKPNKHDLDTSDDDDDCFIVSSRKEVRVQPIPTPSIATLPSTRVPSGSSFHDPPPSQESHMTSFHLAAHESANFAAALDIQMKENESVKRNREVRERRLQRFT